MTKAKRSTFLTPPVAGALFLAALVASCLRGALPPVDLRAVCLVRAIEYGIKMWRPQIRVFQTIQGSGKRVWTTTKGFHKRTPKGFGLEILTEPPLSLGNHWQNARRTACPVTSKIPLLPFTVFSPCRFIQVNHGPQGRQNPCSACQEIGREEAYCWS